MQTIDHINKAGSSRTSTNNSIYILHQVITYNPTLTTEDNKQERTEERKEATNKYRRASQPAEAEAQTVQAIPNQGRMTRLSHGQLKSGMWELLV